MLMTLMGTGTSHGVPVIACGCAVCRSADPRDKRMRASAFVTQREDDGRLTALVIDTGPEFRVQCLRHGVSQVDAVLLTHSHADHLDGLDDVRVFSHTRSQGATTCRGQETPGFGLPVYSNAANLADVRGRFDYIFKETQLAGGKPKLRLENCSRFSPSEPLRIGSLSVLPVPMMHGRVSAVGWLLGTRGADGRTHSVAYLTDCNFIGEESLRLIEENSGSLDCLVIDGLRERQHSTHFTFREALECADRLGARQTWLTHICHNSSHVQIEAWCRGNIASFPRLERIVAAGGSVGPAHDGLVLRVGERDG